ncbi:MULTISPECIES: type II toxin-antitoxin system RelE/ParE family toxin [Brevundimonas]|jgi:plasmid stabilization system protein ParE|uniref:type II toxin-antitoxin system RelE/ParE family toxin n=1 Tax=Brevundimonas TaxID=41275 RepID=UPI000A7D942E|nr:MULTISPECIES: type II toxin-antitoxin system RelE/ParE family toxin [Brevundimonas]
MRTVRWSKEARDGQREWLDLLEQQDPRLTDRALAESEALSLKLGDHPFRYRPSRWRGFREASLLRWRKVVVFQVLPDEVVIVSFYDARQDLAAVQPKSDSN